MPRPTRRLYGSGHVRMGIARRARVVEPVAPVVGDDPPRALPPPGPHDRVLLSAATPGATGSRSKEPAMSSSLSVLDRAASAPRWLVVALSLVAIATLVTVAGYRHLAPVSAVAADAGATIEPAAAATTIRREPIVSRSAPLTRKPVPRGPVANSDA